MKNLLEKPFVKKSLITIGAIIVFLLILDNIIMPWYVSSSEEVVPKVVGLSDFEAIEKLEDAGFEPVIADTSYGTNQPAGKIFLQKPEAGKIVKKGRTVYLFVSGGEQLVTVPQLKGKNIVDAKLALERVGLKLGQVELVASNYPKDMIFDQQYIEGTKLKKGETIKIFVSSGQTEGTIEVPDLIGKSLSEAQKILSDSSLTVGKITYQISNTLLPNTVLDQYPVPGNKLNPGEKVDLFITKQGTIKEPLEIIEE
ncbi:MAG: PASTA domain-containing protein [Ignavibacterium sp.]|nr:PASTA domain-containing protein [Ignavibacterium sp.]